MLGRVQSHQLSLYSILDGPWPLNTLWLLYAPNILIPSPFSPYLSCLVCIILMALTTYSLVASWHQCDLFYYTINYFSLKTIIYVTNLNSSTYLKRKFSHFKKYYSIYPPTINIHHHFSKWWEKNQIRKKKKIKGITLEALPSNCIIQELCGLLWTREVCGWWERPASLYHCPHRM